MSQKHLLFMLIYSYTPFILTDKQYIKCMLCLLSPQIPDKSGESSENDWESDYCHSLEESEEQPSFHLGNKTTDENPSSQNCAGISGTIV